MCSNISKKVNSTEHPICIHVWRCVCLLTKPWLIECVLDFLRRAVSGQCALFLFFWVPKRIIVEHKTYKVYTYNITIPCFQRQIFHGMMMLTVIPPSFWTCTALYGNQFRFWRELWFCFNLSTRNVKSDLSSVCLDTYQSCLSADRLAGPVLLGWCWFSQLCRGCFRLSWSSSHRLTSPCPGLHANYTWEKQSCNLSQKKTTIKQQQKWKKTNKHWRSGMF